MSLPESIQSAMKSTNEFFGETVVKGRDFDALGRVYTVDARILPPGASLTEGLDNIKAFWKAAVEGMDLQGAELVSIDAHMAGDAVIEIGSAELMLPGNQTATVKYVVEWREEDGVWKWHTDIWNA